MKLMETQVNEQSGTSAKKTNNSNSGNTELVNTQEIEGTPFKLIKREKEGYFLVMGEYRITQETDDKEKLIKLAKSLDWNFMVNVLSTMMEIRDKVKAEIDLISANNN